MLLAEAVHSGCAHHARRSLLPSLCRFTALAARSTTSTAPATVSDTEDTFGALPPMSAFRVVVTGLGLVTPLAVGVTKTWARLVKGETGVRRLTEDDLPEVQQ